MDGALSSKHPTTATALPTGDWKRMPEFDRLLLFRALRPDRLTAAMGRFVTNTIGSRYITSQPFDLERSFQDAAPGVPMFVFLSPGARRRTPLPSLWRPSCCMWRATLLVVVVCGGVFGSRGGESSANWGGESPCRCGRGGQRGSAGPQAGVHG
jgi:hypothetical protein